MSEIDAKCEYYKKCQADCICSIEQTETCDSYKLLKQLQRLKKENEILKEGLDYIGVFECSKCGHYTPRGYVCHFCGLDPSIERDRKKSK